MRAPDTRLRLASVLFLLLAATAWPAAVRAGQAVPETLTLTYVKFPLNAPLIIAKSLGLYEKEFAVNGTKVQWADLTAGPKQIQAMAADSVQFASAISADSVLAAKANGLDVAVFGVFSRAPGAFSIMVKNQDIKTVADLKGRTVAGPKGSLMHQLLASALKKNGLEPNDIEFVNMPAAQALSTLLSGGVDAALVAGTGRVKAEAEGARVLANGQGLVKGVILMAAMRPFLAAHPDLAARYLKVHGQALAFLRDKPEEAMALIASETGVTVKDVLALLPDYDFAPEITRDDIADLEATRDFLAHQALLRNPVDPKTLIWN